MRPLATTIPVLALLALAIPLAPVKAQDVAGRWAGRMEPTNLSAEITLNLQLIDASWKAEMTFRAGADGGALPIEELHVSDDSVLVRTKIEGADVSFAFARDGDLLLGFVRVTEKGRVLAEGPAGLARDASGMTRVAAWLDAQGTAIDPARRAAVIERSLDLFAKNYVFQDRAEAAVADVRKREKADEYNSLTSPARLAEVLSRHLADATRDGHVRVKFSTAPVPDPMAATGETSEELAQLRREAQADGYGIGTARVLDGNVGYLELKKFYRAEYAGDALAAAMQKLAKTDALIIDLRECRGGDPVMVALTASWFFDGRPRHLSDMVRRMDGTLTQYWTAAWLPGARYVDKPVYILTAQRTFSAPESFAYEMQQAKRATVVGEVTGGGAHSGAWFPVDDRFSIFIPLTRYVSANSGSDWEGTGVKPDVVTNAPEALKGAHRLALEKLKRK